LRNTTKVRSVAFTPSRLVFAVLACAAVAAVCFVLAVVFGEQHIDLAQVMSAGSPDETIFFRVRLPRVVLAALVGTALAVAGAALQSLLRNPLADPFVLGVSGGAALGATIALALGIGSFALVPAVSGTTVLALAGALGATGLVLSVGRVAGGDPSNTTLLAGVIFNAFALAAITFIKALVAPDRLGEILFWLAGSLGQEQTSTLISTGLVVVLCVAVLVAASARLNLLTLGDEDAQSLGVDARRTRLLVLVVASTAVSAVVSLAGLIGFVGLLVPHLARLLFGHDQRVVLPTSALLGAAFLMVADLLARALFSVFHTEPPVGVITALLGGPVFLLLMVRARRTPHG
jgi:iron complex transport system permease protein